MPRPAVKGDLLIGGEAGSVRLEGLGDHQQEERLCLGEYLVGIAVYDGPGCYRAEQSSGVNDEARLLLDLANSGCKGRLARIDAAAGGYPPARPRQPGVGVGKKQCAVPVGDDHPRGAAAATWTQLGIDSLEPARAEDLAHGAGILISATVLRELSSTSTVTAPGAIA